MKWDVLIYDGGLIRPYNIFDNTRFTDAVTAVLHDPEAQSLDREKLSEIIESTLRWQFWSRCEYECIVSSWPPVEYDPQVKLDVFTQVKINWDRFMDYIMVWRANYWEYEKAEGKSELMQDYSTICSRDDDNDAHCWGCKYFNFPLGCMINEEIELTDEK